MDRVANPFVDQDRSLISKQKQTRMKPPKQHRLNQGKLSNGNLQTIQPSSKKFTTLESQNTKRNTSRGMRTIQHSASTKDTRKRSLSKTKRAEKETSANDQVVLNPQSGETLA